jgi:hypothetical protein
MVRLLGCLAAMPTPIALLTILTIAVVELGLNSAPAQASCQWQYNDCLKRVCARNARGCLYICKIKLRHCKAPHPHLGELIGQP